MTYMRRVDADGRQSDIPLAADKVEREQVEDYARRKAMPLADVERWFGSILNYRRYNMTRRRNSGGKLCCLFALTVSFSCGRV